MSEFAGQSLETVILDTQQLRAHPCLGSLYSMINDAYANRHGDLFPQDGKYLRFPTVDDFTGTIGIHGRCCILLRDQEGKAEPVACAMLKYFNEDLGGMDRSDDADPVEGVLSNGNGVAASKAKNNGYDKEPADLLSISEWELTAVAVRPDPSLKRLGLAMHCSAQLERDLFERLTEAEAKDPSARGQDRRIGDTMPGVTFWIRATSNINAPYWERRGYEVVGETILPKGYWGALRPFGLVTLKKYIPRRYD